MIQLTGERTFSAAIDRVYSELSDVGKVVRTFPDVKQVKEAAPERARIVVSPGLSFVKGELDATIDRISQDPPRSAVLFITSKGIGSSSKIQASFQLEARGEGTLLRWSAEVQELGGLLKLVPSGLLKGSAQKIIEGFLNGLEQQLSG
jgi:carbon monoxide dehydrogenase subunit G